MNRNVIKTVESIFNNIKEKITFEDRHHIVEIERRIKVDETNSFTFDFVKKTEIHSTKLNEEQICVFEYEEQKYLLARERHIPVLKEIGFEIETNLSVIEGAGMIAMAENILSMREEITSISIIEKCLGIEPGSPEETYVEFDFSDIADIFVPYCIVKLNDSIYPLIYEEDLNRLLCYFLVEQAMISPSIKEQIKTLLLLKSSRTISASIINGIKSPLIEYTFLQFYQCIEYLFKLNNCFIISKEHDVPLEKAIDIILTNELKLSEVDNLYRVLRNNASEASIDAVISAGEYVLEKTSDKFRKASEYIYKLRCNIAHLRYDQDDISRVDWIRCTEALIDVILSVYQKCDSYIIQICNSRDTWHRLKKA